MVSIQRISGWYSIYIIIILGSEPSQICWESVFLIRHSTGHPPSSHLEWVRTKHFLEDVTPTQVVLSLELYDSGMNAYVPEEIDHLRVAWMQKSLQLNTRGHCGWRIQSISDLVCWQPFSSLASSPQKCAVEHIWSTLWQQQIYPGVRCWAVVRPSDGGSRWAVDPLGRWVQ